MTADATRAEARRSWIAYTEHEDVADLHAAVASFDETLAAVPDGAEHRARALHESAAARQVRYMRLGDPDDLTASIELTRAAIERRADPAMAAADHANLGNALRLAYEVSGELAALHESIRHARAAVQATPDPHPARATRLSNLGYSLRLRFAHTGRAADIDDAVEVARSALAAAIANDPTLARLQSNLGIALRERHERSGSAEDLHEAVRLAVAAAVGTSTDAPDRPGMLTNLGLALIRRFTLTGDVADLRGAVVAHRAAVDATPGTSPDAATYVLNLATALRIEAEHDDAPSPTDDAVHAAERAELLLPDGHPDHVLSLSAMGRALRLRHRRSGDPEDARRSVAARRAAAAVRTAPPEERAIAASTAAQWAIEDGDAESAASGYAMAVDLLSRVAWHGLESSDRERHLGRWHGLARDAAASALAVGHAGDAVELLEQGRSVLWSQTLQYAAGTADLATVAPAQAFRLDTVGAALAGRMTAR